MDRKPDLAVNKAERMRVRALNQARQGRIDRYWKLVNLSLEVGTIRVLPGHTHTGSP
jgi:hypothetical protein